MLYITSAYYYLALLIYSFPFYSHYGSMEFGHGCHIIFTGWIKRESGQLDLDMGILYHGKSFYGVLVFFPFTSPTHQSFFTSL